MTKLEGLKMELYKTIRKINTSTGRDLIKLKSQAYDLTKEIEKLDPGFDIDSMDSTLENIVYDSLEPENSGLDSLYRQSKGNQYYNYIYN